VYSISINICDNQPVEERMGDDKCDLMELEKIK